MWYAVLGLIALLLVYAYRQVRTLDRRGREAAGLLLEKELARLKALDERCGGASIGSR